MVQLYYICTSVGRMQFWTDIWYLLKIYKQHTPALMPHKPYGAG